MEVVRRNRPGGEDDAGGAVGLAGHPGAVEGVGDEEEGDHAHEHHGHALLPRLARPLRPVLAALAARGLGACRQK